MLFVVKYAGPFGYLKPWTAVRDIETYSQQFLTPSVLEGMRHKLGVSKILRHKLNYTGISLQQEQTQTRGSEPPKGRNPSRPRSILNRGVLIDPELYLAFEKFEDATTAVSQHLCLCRNEDVVLPVYLEEMSEEDFGRIQGFELLVGENIGPDVEGAFLVGYNRFQDAAPMYGKLEITGNPIRKTVLER